MSIGTWLHTKLKGEKVGEDEFGNIYYRSKRQRAGIREERWVVYKDEPEASKVPAHWHAWLHHTTDEPLSGDPAPWQAPHVPNLTGTGNAYLPPGHDARGGARDKATGDYEAWSP